MTATNLLAKCVISEIAYTNLRFKPDKSRKSRSSIISYDTSKNDIEKQAMLVDISNKEKKNVVIRKLKKLV